ncbi:MAG: helix-turn-helix transcriptional regulator [Odoribacter sp.]|nr:helix-turn-helix transcriptional regulator [Odoribacter sp.]
MDEILQLKTIKEYSDYMGVGTRHPLVNVIEGSRMPHPVPHARKRVGMYLIFLKELKCTDELTYGRCSYDFQENTLVFIAPGQVFGSKADGSTFKGSGWCLLFDPELLHGTPLGRRMQDYTFFSYAVNEALHLSKQERETVIDCMRKIDEEIEGATDKHSHTIIASAIELLLNYCLRFYDRQFITRKKENKDTLSSFESLLNDYFLSDKPSQFGTPTVAYCAEQLHLSANYFGDLIKKEMGVSAQEYILSKTMETAKELLADPTKSASEGAYALGYQYPQYFSRAFKRVVGCPPNEYRLN